MYGSTRDTHKSKVYDAEFELRFIRDNNTKGCVDFFGQTLDLPRPRKFGDLDGVQRFIDAVCEMETVTDKWPMSTRRPTARYKRPSETDNFAHYQSLNNEIALPPHYGSKSSWAMDEIVVLHELAHFFTRKVYDEGSHGLSFCLCFLDLLELVLHPTWRLLMTRALDTRGVPLA